MMQLLPPLLADVDWIQIVIVLFFILGPLLSNLGGGNKQAKQQRRLNPRLPPAPGQQPGAPPARPQPGGQQALQKEIDDFLRQAQKRGGQQQRPAERRPPAQRPPQPRPPQPRPPQDQPRRVLSAEEARRRRAKQQALKKQKAKQIREAQQHNLRREGVAEHVESHIKSKPVTDHAKQLGQRVGHADEDVEQHLHEVFDHKIGELGQSTADTSKIEEGTDAEIWANVEERRARDEAQVDVRTADIARIMRDPVSMREAIILSEILKPPKALD